MKKSGGFMPLIDGEVASAFPRRLPDLMLVAAVLSAARDARQRGVLLPPAGHYRGVDILVCMRRLQDYLADPTAFRWQHGVGLLVLVASLRTVQSALKGGDQ